MINLVINPILQKQLDAYVADPSHAVLLYGKKASGKKALAAYLAECIKNSKQHSVVIYVYPLEDKKTIGIDQIKQLKISLRTKDEAYRIIVIPDADIMTTEAQNSFLKLLEEPPKNVLFILTSSRSQYLLSTIRSRLLKLRYIAPTSIQMTEYLAKYTNIPVEKYTAIADGRMGLLSALASGEESYILLQNIELAKDILHETASERLVRVDALSKNIDAMQSLLDALLLTCNAALTSSIKNSREYTRWLERLTALEAADTQLSHNVSAKLVLSRLFLVL